MAGSSPGMTAVGMVVERILRWAASQPSPLARRRNSHLDHLTRTVAAGAERKVSTTIVDRNGKLLRAYAMADGRWRLLVDAKTSVDPTYLKLLLAYEDRRFYSHHGVDPLALGRAAFQLVTPATSCPAARRSRCNWRA